MRAQIAAALTVLGLAGCGGGDDSTSTAGPDLDSPQVEQVRTCLLDEGFDVVGEVSSPTGSGAPDAELVLSVDGDQVFVAFYRDSTLAADAEAVVRDNASLVDSLVERRGAVTIVWDKRISAENKRALEACAFT